MYNISLEDMEKLLKDLYNFNYNDHIKNDINPTQVSFANEVLLAENVNSLAKLSDLIRYSYEDYHYSIIDSNNRSHNYEIFKFKKYDIDPKNLYQIIGCNGWIDIYKFSQDNYDKKKTVAHFMTPSALVYSFYDGLLIIIEDALDEKYDFDYKIINAE